MQEQSSSMLSRLACVLCWFFASVVCWPWTWCVVVCLFALYPLNPAARYPVDPTLGMPFLVYWLPLLIAGSILLFRSASPSVLLIRLIGIFLCGCIPFLQALLYYLFVPAYIVPFMNDPVGRMIALGLLIWQLVGMGLLLRAQKLKTWLITIAGFILPLVLVLRLGPEWLFYTHGPAAAAAWSLAHANIREFWIWILDAIAVAMTLIIAGTTFPGWWSTKRMALRTSGYLIAGACALFLSAWLGAEAAYLWFALYAEDLPYQYLTDIGNLFWLVALPASMAVVLFVVHTFLAHEKTKSLAGASRTGAKNSLIWLLVASFAWLIAAWLPVVLAWQNVRNVPSILRVQNLVQHHKFQEAKELNRQLEEETHGSNLALAAKWYDQDLLLSKRYDDAEASLQFALARLQAEKPPDLIAVSFLQTMLARVFRNAQQLPKAEAALKAALQTVNEAHKAGVPTTENVALLQTYPYRALSPDPNVSILHMRAAGRLQLSLLNVYLQEDKFDDAATLVKEMLANKDLKFDADELAEFKKLQMETAQKRKSPDDQY